jgi:hypothetical protein
MVPFLTFLSIHQGTRNKLTYDGMWHLDIPKTRQYDDGKLEVVARNSQGSASCVVELKVTARNDDHRGVLKKSPKRESFQPPPNVFIRSLSFLL